MKIGTTEIQKVYLGTTELDGLYVGSNSAYVKPSSGGIDEHTVLMCHYNDSLEDVSSYENLVTLGSGTSSSSYSFSDGKFNKSIVAKTTNSAHIIYGTTYSDTNPFNDLLVNTCTLDFWMKKTDCAGTSIYFRRKGNTDSLMIKRTISGDTLSLDASSSSTLSVDISDIPADSWFHVAMVNEGTVETGVGHKFLFYVNGVYKGFTKWSHATLTDIYQLKVYLNNIDELRLSDNVRWSGNFTPPTQPYSWSTTYPAGPAIDNNTVEVFHCETDLPTSSDTELTGALGNMKIYRQNTTGTHYASGASVNSNFGNSYWQAKTEAVGIRKATGPTTASLFNSNEFTVDFWVRIKESTDNNKELISWSNGDWYYLYLTGLAASPRSLMLTGAGITSETVADCFPLDAYNHIELSRSSAGVIRVFCNGTKIIEQSTTANMLDSNWSMYIGDSQNKKLEEIRVSNVVRHTADFTPPTGPYTGA